MERGISFHHASGGVGGICGFFFLSDDTEPHNRRNSFPFISIHHFALPTCWGAAGVRAFDLVFLFRGFFFVRRRGCRRLASGVLRVKGIGYGSFIHLPSSSEARDIRFFGRAGVGYGSVASCFVYERSLSVREAERADLLQMASDPYACVPWGTACSLFCIWMGWGICLFSCAMMMMLGGVERVVSVRRMRRGRGRGGGMWIV